MNYISDILYWISTGLLVPVILVLIFLFVRALILLGGFFGQYQTMRRNEASLRKIINNLSDANIDELPAKLEGNKSKFATYVRLLFQFRKSPAQIEHVLNEAELDGEKEMNLPIMLAKMGPTVGLMGTLIPMGPALVGLAAGDIASMAYNMQVAFATTVVGLFASAIGFITKQVKQRWNLRQISDLELIASILKEQKPCAED